MFLSPTTNVVTWPDYDFLHADGNEACDKGQPN